MAPRLPPAIFLLSKSSGTSLRVRRGDGPPLFFLLFLFRLLLTLHAHVPFIYIYVGSLRVTMSARSIFV